VETVILNGEVQSF